MSRVLGHRYAQKQKPRKLNRAPAQSTLDAMMACGELQARGFPESTWSAAHVGPIESAVTSYAPIILIRALLVREDKRTVAQRRAIEHYPYREVARG